MSEEEEERMAWEAEWHREIGRHLRALVVNWSLGEDSRVAREAELHVMEAKRLEGLLDG